MMTKEETQHEQWKNEAGTCIHCGSSDIEYGLESRPGHATIIYEYKCLSCGNLGEEEYAIEFCENKKR